MRAYPNGLLNAGGGMQPSARLVQNIPKEAKLGKTKIINKNSVKINNTLTKNHIQENHDEPVIVVWSDVQDDEPAQFFDESIYPNIGFFHIWHSVSFVRKGWPEYQALFVVPADLSATEPEENSPYCNPDSLFVSLSVRGSLPEPAIAPSQTVHGGWDGVVQMIDRAWPDVRKILVSLGTEQSHVPAGWELFGAEED